jgi:hypothetical protein
MEIIDEENREFFTSQTVRFELLTKPRFENRDAEVAFYETHFKHCSFSAPLSKELSVEAEKLATRYGLAGPDAFQLAAALRHREDEFYTAERPGKPMFRVKQRKVISLFSLLTQASDVPSRSLR